MPIYEYQCDACGTLFEVMHSINGDGPEQCETKNCKGTPHRQISATGFILKGGGWYSSEYPSEARREGWKQESQAANPKAAAPAEGSSSEAPAAAPAATPDSANPAPKESSMAKAANKNPYSGGKKKASKSTGKKSQ